MLRYVVFTIIESDRYLNCLNLAHLNVSMIAENDQYTIVPVLKFDQAFIKKNLSAVSIIYPRSGSAGKQVLKP